MFARKADPLDSLIGVDARVDGHLQFRGGLRIDGQVCGNVTAEADQPAYLVLGEHGRIEGEVRCPRIIISGEIKGPVYASELLEIQPKARIIGDVYYKVLEMHGGALVSGQLSRHDDTEPVLHLAASEA
jgi:cytoskeletal protein CcmA (bactofilin family)